MPRWLVVAIAVAAVACQSSDVSRALGARCDVSSECDERCLAPGAGWPGGFCTIACDTDDDCPGGARCAEVDGGVCLIDCADDAQCTYLGDGWTCQTIAGHPGPDMVMVCAGS
jgi:hypothetical protein